VSNWALDKQYREIQKNDGDSWDAFERRIHKEKWYTGDRIIENDYKNDLVEVTKNENPFIQNKI
jgi:hypothetical protein